jgi:hypothetical protein
VRLEAQEAIDKERAIARTETKRLIEQEQEKAEETLFALKTNIQETVAQIKAQAADEAVSKVRADAEESTANVRAEFKERLLKLQAETQEAILREKTRTDEKEKAYIGIIETLKAESAQKSKAHTEEMEKIKAQLGITMVRIKVEADNAIAKEQIKIKELQKQINTLKSIINPNAAMDNFKSGRKEIVNRRPVKKSSLKTEESISRIRKFAQKLTGYIKTEETKEMLKNSPMTSSKP